MATCTYRLLVSLLQGRYKDNIIKNLTMTRKHGGKQELHWAKQRDHQAKQRDAGCRNGSPALRACVTRLSLGEAELWACLLLLE